MCLHSSLEETTKLLRTQKGKITCYKVLNSFGNRLDAIHCHKIYKPGNNVSDATENKCTIYNTSVHNGIHVARTLERAKALQGFSRLKVIVKVTCDLKDLMGANINEAVFYKVHLSQEEYDRAIGKKKIKKKKAK
jgi:hypothetical protein